jgi:hypothetical protein
MLFQATGCFEPTKIQAHHASMMISKISALKSRIKTHASLEEIITSRNDIFKNFESDMAVGIRKLVNPDQETAESNGIVMPNAGS